MPDTLPYEKIGSHPEWTGSHGWTEFLEREDRLIEKIKGGTGSFADRVSRSTIPWLGSIFEAAIESSGSYIG
jgi:hypothetical protein